MASSQERQLFRRGGFWTAAMPFRVKCLARALLILCSCTVTVIPWQEAFGERLVTVKPIRGRSGRAIDPKLLALLREVLANKDISLEEVASYAWVDINGDGVKELFLLMYIGWCGSAGCTTKIFQKAGGGWTEICAFQGYPPYRLVDIWDHGYRRIIETGRDTMVHWAADGTCR